MLRIFDRYIIRQFLGTFFFILLLIMSIAIVFDISEKTKDFAKMTATFWEIVTLYYFNFVIYYANLFSGLLIFLAVLIFTSRLAHRSEVIATLSGGVSFLRFLWPFFISASILAGIALFTNHYVLPHANKERLMFEEEHIRAKFFVEGKDLHRQIEEGIIAYCHEFRVGNNTAYSFALEKWNEEKELISKLRCDRAEYDTLQGSWKLYNGTIRVLGTPKDRITHFITMDTTIALEPQDLGRRQNSYTAMATPELIEFIKKEKLRGSESVVFAEIERYQRTSMPFATYIFTLIGVSIASRKLRGGTGAHLAAGVVLILIYIFSIKITTVAATNAGMNAMWAVWIPNIIFGFIGLYIYKKAPK
jgi:lipopolysaccharide export system permease protein